MLRRSGIPAIAAGNVDTPLVEAIDRTAEPVAETPTDTTDPNAPPGEAGARPRLFALSRRAAFHYSEVVFTSGPVR